MWIDVYMKLICFIILHSRQQQVGVGIDKLGQALKGLSLTYYEYLRPESDL